MTMTGQEISLIDVEDWLEDQIGPASKKLVTDHPWAQTYRVSTGGETYFLKVLPEAQRGGLFASIELGERFAGIVPQTVGVNIDHGFVLLRDHGGRDIGSRASFSDRLGVLRTYADLQTKCSTDSRVLASLPILDFVNFTTEFCRWIADDAESSDYVGAVHFLGTERSRFYSDRLSARAALIEEAVLESRQLPQTVNHCDLRMQNTAVREDGSFVLFDWDEVVSGPAGMSLHNFFSGCSTVVRLLDEIEIGEDAEQIQLLTSYLDALADKGYASRDLIRSCLPGAVCAGVLRFIMSFSKFPLSHADDREQVAKMLVRRLDDLLIFCDLRATNRSPDVVRLVDDYVVTDRPEHARNLLTYYLQKSPDDVDLQVILAKLHRAAADDDAAEQLCRRSLESLPANAGLRHVLGSLLLDRLSIDDAVEQMHLAATFAPHDQTIRRDLESARLFQELERHAARSGCVPTIRFTDEERFSGTISTAKRRLAGRLFRENGALIVEGVYDAGLMDQLNGTFEQQYGRYLSDDRPDDALKVGNQRFMITVDVADKFNAPNLYAAPLLMPILSRLLGDEFILGSFTAVTSLPGAADMRMHKDHPKLFSEDEWSGSQPTVGVTTLIPLKGFDLTMGTTRVVKRSHRRSSDEASSMEWQDPCAPKGSCLLMDYRLSHQGLANRSSHVRPVLSLVYNRPWFRDYVNYAKQDPLRITRAEFDLVPSEWRHLFSWIRP